MELKKSIVASPTPPTNKDVIWLDTRTRTLRVFISTLWYTISGESLSVDRTELDKAISEIMDNAARLAAIEGKADNALAVSNNTASLIGTPSSEGAIATAIYDNSGNPVTVDNLAEGEIYYLDANGNTPATEGTDYTLPTKASGLYELLENANGGPLSEIEFEIWENSVRAKYNQTVLPVNSAINDGDNRNIKDTYVEKADLLTISKEDSYQYLGIDSTNENYYKIFFINGGEGIVTRGQLFAASPYFIKIVDDQVPESEREEGTLYLVEE